MPSITTQDFSKSMNNRYRVAVRVGNLYCSYPLGVLCLGASGLILKCRPFLEIFLSREHILSFEIKRSLICRFIRIRHNDNRLPIFIDIYFLRHIDQMLGTLEKWRNGKWGHKP